MFGCLNLDSVTIQPVQHFVGGKRHRLTNSDEFHLCTHALSVSASSVYSVVSLGQILCSLFVLINFVSSMSRREEKRDNFSGIMHSGNEQEILDSSSVYR